MNDGGPAFPTHEGYRVPPDLPIITGGMSLRDYFAGQVLNGYLAMHAIPNVITPEAKECVRVAYEYADAMLAERAKKEEKDGRTE